MNYENYLDLVVQTIVKNQKPDSNCLTSAALGGLLRQACPEENWKTFGKRALSEILTDLEYQGRLSITKTDKDALAVTLGNTAALPTVASIEKFNPLRKSIWDAFVLMKPEGRRFMHRRNGTVRVALDIAPPPADDWVEIFAIGTEKQKEWAHAFIADGYGSEAAEQTLSDANWNPHLFVQTLRQSDENIARLWNRYRTAKVSSVVKDWLVQHTLVLELAFQSNIPNVVANSSSAETGSQIPANDTEDVRHAILTALSTLPLDKLLEIPIPAGAMLSALSNAKLR